MFERFSKTARRAVVVAQEEARELRSPQIDVEHVLLGVLSSPDAPLRKILTDNGITAEQIRDRLTTEISSEPLGADDAAALESIGIDLEAVRDSVQATFGEDVFDEPAPAAKGRGKFRLGGIVNFGHIPFSKDAKKTLELSLREAISRGDDSIRTGHILLGILRAANPTTKELLGGSEGMDRLREATHEILDRAA